MQLLRWCISHMHFEIVIMVIIRHCIILCLITSPAFAITKSRVLKILINAVGLGEYLLFRIMLIDFMVFSKANRFYLLIIPLAFLLFNNLLFNVYFAYHLILNIANRDSWRHLRLFLGNSHRCVILTIVIWDPNACSERRCMFGSAITSEPICVSFFWWFYKCTVRTTQI